MELAYKFRIYPTAIQEQQIITTLGCCRWVYNHALDERIALYKTCGKSFSYYEQSSHLTYWKKLFAWLKEADATALQSALKDLDRAYNNFSMGLASLSLRPSALLMIRIPLK